MAGRGNHQNMAPKQEGAHKLKLAELQKEKESIDSSLEALPIISDIINSEIERLNRNDMRKYVELHHDKPTKVAQKVSIPVKEFPKYNFVGKILGPGGQNLKTLQQETGTRMAVLGRGSTRDKKVEEANREGGDPKFAHLKEELHVLIECVAPPVAAYERIASAMSALQQYLNPSLMENAPGEGFGGEDGYANGGQQHPPLLGGGGRGRGRGMPPPSGGRGRGALLAQPSARDERLGRPGAPRAPPRAAARGALLREDPYYAPPERRSAYEDQRYGEDPYARDEYAREPAAPAAAYRDPYDYPAERPRAAASSDTQYFDYGHGSSSSARESAYADYGGDSWGQGQSAGGYGKAPPARPKPVADLRAQPYSARPAARAPRY